MQIQYKYITSKPTKLFLCFDLTLAEYWQWFYQKIYQMGMALLEDILLSKLDTALVFYSFIAFDASYRWGF